MDAAEGTSGGAKRCTRSLPGMAMHCASAITVIIPCPLVHAVADGAMARMAAPIALPLIDIEPCAARRNILHDQRGAGARVGMVAAPQALLACVPRDDADDRGTVVGIGAVPLALIDASAEGIGRSAMGRAFFPRVLIQFIGLKGRAAHHVGRCAVVDMGVDAVSQGVELFARQPQCAREASGRLALGTPTQQQHQGGRALPGLGKHGPRQQRVITIAGPTAVGWKMRLLTEQAPLGLPAVRTGQPIWVTMAFEPTRTGTLIK